MEIKTTAEYLKQHYPNEYKEIIQKFQTNKGKSTAGKTIDDIKFRFSWAIGINMSNPFMRPTSIKTNPLQEGTDQEVLEHLKVAAHISVGGHIKHWSHYVHLNTVPEPVLNMHLKQRDECVAERRRVDSLTPKQRDAETEELLEQLFAGGLTMIGFGSHGPTVVNSNTTPKKAASIAMKQIRK
jgi:hypothetical protein